MRKWTLTTLYAMWHGIQGRRSLALVVTFTHGTRELTGMVTGMGAKLGVYVDGELFEDVYPSAITWAEVTGPHLNAVKRDNA